MLNWIKYHQNPKNFSLDEENGCFTVATSSSSRATQTRTRLSSKVKRVARERAEKRDKSGWRSARRRKIKSPKIRRGMEKRKEIGMRLVRKKKSGKRKTKFTENV